MSLKRRQFNREFKVEVLREVESGKTVAQVARERQVHPITITRWRGEQRRYGEKSFAGQGILYKHEARIADLERMIGQLTMENALLKKALTRVEEQLRETRVAGKR